MKLYLHLLFGTLFTISVDPASAQEQLGRLQPSSELALPAPIMEFMDSDHQYPFGKKNERMPEELAQFGQLTGVWKMTTHALHQGKWYSGWPSYWIWKYAVDGTIILDYFYQSKEDFPPILPNNFDTHGLNMRIYDPETDSWKITWIANSGPESRISARYINEEIHMKSMASDSSAWRIIFSEISESSFRWRQERRSESGEWDFQLYLMAERLR